MKNILLLLLLISFICNGQTNYTLNFKAEKPLLHKKIENKNFKDSLTLLNTLESLRLYDIKKGYILANIDTITWQTYKATINYHLGTKFNKAKISLAPASQELLSKVSNVNEKFLLNLDFNPHQIEKLFAQLLYDFENAGYPFVQLKLSNSKIENANLITTLNIEPGPEMLFSEIEVKGDSSISKKYLSNYINIKVGDAYSEEKLNNIANRIAQINFLSEIKKHEILFTPDGVKLYLYIKSNPVSLVNGIVGIQPNPNTGKSVITGDLKLKLQNVLKRGELLGFNWRSIKPETQQLNIEFNYPFLFNTPFGLDTKFDLYKRDSTFLNTNTRLGIQYFLKGGNYLKAFYAANRSNILSGGQNSGNTNLADVSINEYGLGLYRRRLDYIPNPSKGLIIDLEGNVGARKVTHLDTNTTTQSTTFRINLKLDWFLPITKRNIIRINNTTATYYANEIFFNEQYRFGGLNSQRGFNEEELFATTLSTTRLEYRFIVDKNSHAFAFYDQTIYENNSNGYLKDNPFGFGAGFSFGTNLGIFSISYAIGKQFNNPILISNGKVHFGYIAYF